MRTISAGNDRDDKHDPKIVAAVARRLQRSDFVAPIDDAHSRHFIVIGSFAKTIPPQGPANTSRFNTPT